jgi:Secretion system C-terminal sorting domain
MRKNFTYLFVVLSFITLNSINAQTLIWPADTNQAKISQFNGGLNGWTVRGGTVDDNDNFFADAKIKWEWSAKGKRPFAGATDSSAALTAGNGLMVFDAENSSALAGLTGFERVFGDLTSPIIDVDGKNDLTLTYSSYFYNNGSNTYVTWSEDGGGTWKDTINVEQFVKSGIAIPGATVAGNEYAIGTFISSYTDDDVKVKLVGSKGTKNFQIRFIFVGPRFFWFVDDVELYQYNNDMQVNRNFFAIAPNYETPKNQVEPIPFLSDISNQGNKPQTNVKLAMTVRNLTNNTFVLLDTLNYGTVKADTLIENKLMAKTFTPASGANGAYRATYRILSDSADQYRFNDTASSLFRTGDSIFRKEIGGIYSTRPSNRFWGTGVNHLQRIGNYFYVVKGKSSTATSMSVRLGFGATSDLRGKVVSAYLYKWNQPKPPAVDSNVVRAKDLTIVAYGDLTIPAAAANGATFSIPIANENPSVSGKFAYLEDNTPYLAVIEYSPTTASGTPSGDMTVVYDNRFDYSAMELASQLSGNPRRTSVFGGLTGATSFYINSNDSTLMSVTPQDFAINLFGTNTVPVVRLTVVPFRVNTNDILSDANKMEIYPNPTQNFVTLDFDLEKSTDVMIRIVNINGQIVLDKQYGVTKKERTELNVSHLPSGSYMMQILTADGVKTKQFTIAK